MKKRKKSKTSWLLPSNRRALIPGPRTPAEAWRIFISGPLRGGDPDANVLAAIDAAEEVLLAGHVPFLPHLFHIWNEVHHHPEETWLRLDLAWLRLCDCLLRLLGESAGADLEEDEARRAGLPVFYNLDDLLSATAGAGPPPSCR